MKRDMDLCRKILLAIESSPANQYVTNLQVAGYEDDIVADHVALLNEATLIDANISRTLGPDSPHFVIKNLTWKGYDFLDVARHENIWIKAKQRLANAGMESTDLAILMSMLKEISKSALGLG